MIEGAPAASKRPAAGLVELERELEGLLLEYESLSRAWPKEPHILTRAKIGRRVEDSLRRVYELQHAIAAVQLRGLAVLLDGQDGPILGLQAVLDDQRETVRRLLGSSRLGWVRCISLTALITLSHTAFPSRSPFSEHASACMAA